MLHFRNMPINMQFFAGLNSPIHIDAGGWAKYKEAYLPFVAAMCENNKLEMKAGLRWNTIKWIMM